MRLVLKLSGNVGEVAATQTSYSFDQFGGSVGRGDDNNWTLPDPDRKLSRKHFTIDFDGGGFWLTDLSSNGVYLNYAGERLEQGRRVRLNNGDHLRLGDYEMDVWIETAAGDAVNTNDSFSVVLAGRQPPPLSKDALDSLLEAPGGATPPRPAAGPPANPFTAPLPPAAAGRADDLWPDAFPGGEDDSLFGPRPAVPAAPRAAFPDHVPVENEFFRPPQPIRQPLPDHLRPPGGPATAGSALPDDFGEDLSDLLGQPPASPMNGRAAVAAVGPGAPAPRAASPAPFASAGAAAEATTLLNAFFDGLGIAPPDLAGQPPEAALRAAGLLFRCAVTGLRDLLAARSAIKNELHVERTMIRTGGNNPLKFYATVEEALAALFGSAKPGYLSGTNALDEAVGDLQAHEMAMLVGLQETLQTVLERFDPKVFEERVGSGLIPATRKAKCWDAFRIYYEHFVEDFRDDAGGLVGRDLANAYRRQLGKLHDE